MSQEVQRMFDRIAARYDRANTVLSLGQDRRWRRIAVAMSQAGRGDAVLDVACGTGVLTRRLARKVGPTGHVVGVDFSRQMLDVAKRSTSLASGGGDGAADARDAAQEEAPSRRAAWRRRGRQAPVRYGWADAQALPFPDDAFDAATMAFGIRNVDDPRRALAELGRVVRPGGRVVVLEFGQPGGLRGIGYRFYARLIMPRLGGWITGDRQAYEYLPRTAAAFPAGGIFVALMQQAHPWRNVAKRRLMGGLVWCYAGTVAKHGDQTG